MSKNMNSRVMEVISPDDNEKINQYIDEVKDIYNKKIPLQELDELIDEQRTKIFRDIETQYDYYGEIDIEFILERRMKMLVMSVQEDEKTEELFSIDLRMFKGLRSVFRSEKPEKSADTEINLVDGEKVSPSILLFLFPLLSLTFFYFVEIKDVLLVFVMILLGLMNLLYINRIDTTWALANISMYIISLVLISEFAFTGQPRIFYFIDSEFIGDQVYNNPNFDNLMAYSVFLYSFWLFSLAFKIISRFQLMDRTDKSIRQIPLLRKILLSVGFAFVFTIIAYLVMIVQFVWVSNSRNSSDISGGFFLEAVFVIITITLLMIPISQKLHSAEMFTFEYGRELTSTEFSLQERLKEESFSDLSIKVILTIDDKKVKSFYGLQRRIINKSSIFLIFLIILDSLLIFRIDNTSTDIFNRYAHRLYIDNTDRYTRFSVTIILAIFGIFLIGILLLIIIVGIAVWLSRRGSNKVIHHLYFSNNVEVPYKVLLTPPLGLTQRRYRDILSNLLYNNIITIRFKSKMEG